MKFKKSMIGYLVFSLVISGLLLQNFEIVNAAKKSQTITVGSEYYKKDVNDKKFSLQAKAKTKITYISSDKQVATVSTKGIVTIQGVGSTTITLKAASSDAYKGTSTTVSLRVSSIPSDKPIVSMVLKNGKEIEAGSNKKVTLKELKGATFKLNSYDKDKSYKYATIISASPYIIANDPEPNFAYEGVFLDTSNKSIKKNFTTYFENSMVDKKKSIEFSSYLYELMLEDKYYNNVCIFLQEVNDDGTDGDYYIENNFIITR